MRLFWLDRIEDATGISGTGRIAEGVQFHDGKCVLSWLSEHTSVVVYDSIESVEAIHGHGGKTVVRWHLLEFAERLQRDFGAFCVDTPVGSLRLAELDGDVCHRLLKVVLGATAEGERRRAR